MSHEFALAHAQPGAGPVIDFSGRWVNELQSEMTLKQEGFVILGEYVSAVSSEGKKAKGVLSGYVNGDLISFVVHWQDFQAITAWVGQLNPKAPKQTINTLWQMTNQVEAGQEWASINAGADTFTRQ